MPYQKTLDYLFGRLPIYQRTGAAAYKADIGNIVAASKYLGNPHTQFKSVHIAGTNGKGSTAHMLSSILQESGYKVGLYTSPHLKDFRERIRINGKMIAEQEVVDFVKESKAIFEEMELSFFEFTVAMAFDYFANQQVDIAIIETGLGGRLDSTNILNPELTIITNIGLDHTNLLGNTLEKIAVEKGGIIKENTPIIIGRKQKETNTIFQNIAKEKNAHLMYSEPQQNYATDLKGKYQKENLNTTITAIEQLQEQGWAINSSNIEQGLLKIVANTQLLGRWQTLSKIPHIICDTGHNEDGIKQISKQLKNTKFEQLHFVFGTVNDKNLDSILSHLPKNASYYFCQANIPRAMDAKELQQKSAKYELKGNVFTIVKQALSKAKENANASDLIFVGGSTFVVAEAL
ncbi:MAG: dihydrofolate synthase/folylpolyglutamate synthase [Thalassomonas sp.]|jgi:dihydrofolate synthase/folylpolyglutamate synthase